MPITLMELFQKGMIIQHSKPILIRGWCAPLDELTLFFDTNMWVTKADEKGRFDVELAEHKVGGPYTIRIESKHSGHYTLEDIWVGEVWLCSGQSNMQMLMDRQMHPLEQERQYSKLACDRIHVYTIPIEAELSQSREHLSGGRWMQGSAESIGECSALAYYLGTRRKEVFEGKIGLIIAAQGGTPIDAWLDTVNKVEATEIQQQFEQETIAEKLWRDTCAMGKKPVTASAWASVHLPGFFAHTQIGSMCGVLSLRKTLHIPDDILMTLTEETSVYLSLGTMVDSDITYVNGVKVGETGYQYPPRFYEVPRQLVEDGRVTIEIELTITGGKGRMTPDKPYYLQIGNWRHPLEGEWQYQIRGIMEERMPQIKPLERYSGALYRSMLAPLAGIKTQGVIWYQGESDTEQYEIYEGKLIQLFRQFRQLQKEEDLPIYCVQLPEFTIDLEPSDQGWEGIRRAQHQACIKSKSTLVETMGLGDWNDLHPRNKEAIADRVHHAIEQGT